MQALRRKGIVVLAVIGMLAMSGLASAAFHEVDEPEDTVFNYGYDAGLGELSWETWAIGDSATGGQTVEVSGPNEQINHGTVMKAFNSVYEGQGRGCLNRYLAQSDFGRGDTAVFEVLADCEHGRNGNGAGTASSSDRPGKSGAAPGHNKET